MLPSMISRAIDSPIGLDRRGQMRYEIERCEDCSHIEENRIEYGPGYGKVRWQCRQLCGRCMVYPVDRWERRDDL